MAFTFISSKIGYTGYGPQKTVNTSATLNVATGDLIIAYGLWIETASGGATISDGGSNSCAMEAEVSRGGYVNVVCGYKLNATANATATFTLTLVNNSTYLHIIVLQFRSAGATITKDQSQASGTGWSTAAQSGNITTTETDEVVASFCGTDYGAYSSSEQIGDIAADGVIDCGGVDCYPSAWYRILTGTAAGIHSQSAYAGNAEWQILLNSFKATAAAGGTNVSIYKKYYDYRRSQ